MQPCKPLAQRLREYARPAANGCVVWTAQLTKSGYAKTKAMVMWSDTKTDRVSRLVLARRLRRDLLPHEFAMHKCDNPACVRSSHIVLGNALLNNRDTVAKGRFVASSNKLTPTVVAEIHALRRGRRMSQAEIGKRFGVSQVAVSKVLRGYAPKFSGVGP